MKGEDRLGGSFLILDQEGKKGDDFLLVSRGGGVGSIGEEEKSGGSRFAEWAILTL